MNNQYNFISQWKIEFSIDFVKTSPIPDANKDYQCQLYLIKDEFQFQKQQINQFQIKSIKGKSQEFVNVTLIEFENNQDYIQISIQSRENSEIVGIISLLGEHFFDVIQSLNFPIIKEKFSQKVPLSQSLTDFYEGDLNCSINENDLSYPFIQISFSFQQKQQNYSFSPKFQDGYQQIDDNHLLTPLDIQKQLNLITELSKNKVKCIQESIEEKLVKFYSDYQNSNIKKFENEITLLQQKIYELQNLQYIQLIQYIINIRLEQKQFQCDNEITKKQQKMELLKQKIELQNNDLEQIMEEKQALQKALNNYQEENKSLAKQLSEQEKNNKQKFDKHLQDMITQNEDKQTQIEILKNDEQTMKQKEKDHINTIEKLQYQLKEVNQEFFQFKINSKSCESLIQSSNQENKLQDFSNQIKELEIERNQLQQLLESCQLKWKSLLSSKSCQNEQLLDQLKQELKLLQNKNEQLQQVLSEKTDLIFKLNFDQNEQRISYSKLLQEHHELFEKLKKKMTKQHLAKQEIEEQLQEQGNALCMKREENSRLEQQIEELKEQIKKYDQFIESIKTAYSKGKVESLGQASINEQPQQQLNKVQQRSMTFSNEGQNEQQDYEDIPYINYEEVNKKSPNCLLSKIKPLPIQNEISQINLIDQQIEKFMEEHSEQPIKFIKIGSGQYQFGSRKVHASIKNDKLVIRIGGGYLSLQEFLNIYTQQELVRKWQQEEQNQNNNVVQKKPKQIFPKENAQYNPIIGITNVQYSNWQQKQNSKIIQITPEKNMETVKILNGCKIKKIQAFPLLDKTNN